MSCSHREPIILRINGEENIDAGLITVGDKMTFRSM